jgi:hypothetical protein
VKFLVSFIIGIGSLLLTSGTIIDSQPPVQPPVVPVVVDIHVSEYPGPFLNIGGKLKYHVLINGRIVGMHDEDARAILNIFKIPAYTPEQFYKLGLDNQIWASQSPGKRFSGDLVSVRSR